jgi:succinoglycan biosynthesis protein ExoA
MKKVSLYIPTLNSSKTIKFCLNSIINQIFKPDEILIVDGNSTDNTIEIIQSIKNKTKLPIRILKQDKKGLANARNLAIKNVKYDYIASIDSDCVADKNWLKELMETFQDENITGAGGELIEKSQISLFDIWRKQHMSQNWGNKMITNPPFLYGSNSLFKKEPLKKLKGYNETYLTNYEDVDLSEKLLKKGYLLIYNPKAICYHIRKDTFYSLLNTYYNWTFYGYPQPNNLLNLFLKLSLFNIINTIKLIIKDILSLNLNLILLDFCIYFHNSYKDIKYYIKK